MYSKHLKSSLLSEVSFSEKDTIHYIYDNVTKLRPLPAAYNRSLSSPLKSILRHSSYKQRKEISCAHSHADDLPPPLPLRQRSLELCPEILKIRVQTPHRCVTSDHIHLSSFELSRNIKKNYMKEEMPSSTCDDDSEEDIAPPLPLRQQSLELCPDFLRKLRPQQIRCSSFKLHRNKNRKQKVINTNSANEDDSDEGDLPPPLPLRQQSGDHYPNVLREHFNRNNSSLLRTSKQHQNETSVGERELMSEDDLGEDILPPPLPLRRTSQESCPAA